MSENSMIGWTFVISKQKIGNLAAFSHCFINNVLAPRRPLSHKRMVKCWINLVCLVSELTFKFTLFSSFWVPQFPFFFSFSPSTFLIHLLISHRCCFLLEIQISLAKALRQLFWLEEWGELAWQEPREFWRKNNWGYRKALTWPWFNWFGKDTGIPTHPWKL